MPASVPSPLSLEPRSQAQGLAWVDRTPLAALVLLRTALVGERLLAAPARYWNAEESYNASVGWLLGHGALWSQLLTLQYRSFCGGCTVVSVAAAPLLGLADRFVLWKGLALLWAAATMVLGFLALDRWVGRAGAWAWALLCALPPPGAADLSLMLWGNHQETALFGVLALLLIARERGFLSGLVLGVALWFARTAAYQVVVLLPAALIFLPRQRLPTCAGFGLGILLLLLPSAAGDAGFYRMGESLGASTAEMVTRAQTLFSPDALASRLFLRQHGFESGAVVFLGVAAIAAVLLLPGRRTWVFPALAIAYALAYCGTRFPLFIVTARAPINNLRYHAPWFFALTLLVAAGAGRAWARSRVGSVLLVAAPLIASACAWRTDQPLLWEAAWSMRASNPVELADVATQRIPTSVLAQTQVADPPVAGLVARMLGLRLGDEVMHGKVRRADALARAGSDQARAGLGQVLAIPCADPSELNAWLDSLDPEVAGAVGRGAAITLALCHTEPKARSVPSAVSARVAGLRSPTGCWLCGAAGAVALNVCVDERTSLALGRCLSEATEGVDEARRVLYTAGALSVRPARSARELAEIARGIGAQGDAFLDGTRDPMAGISEPYHGRDGEEP